MISAARNPLRQDLKALVYALSLHALIGLMLLVNFYWPGKSDRRIENVIKARVVLDQPVSKSAPVQKKTLPPVVDKKKIAQEKAAALKKKRAKEMARKAAQKKKQQAAAARRRQQQAQKELQQALEAEERERTAQANQAKAMAAMSEFEGLIRQRITRNWNQPVGVPSGLSCLVRVRLAAGGEILAVSVVKSSGNALFDRSVENAVYKAAPLPVPQDPELFNYVREINIRFDPED